MGKRIVTALIICMLTTACILSFTACGSKDIARGEEVTAEGWKTAIEATLNATNFTVECTESKKTNEMYPTAINYTSESIINVTAYLSDDIYYGKATCNYNDKTQGSDQVIDASDTTEIAEQFGTVKGSTFWICIYQEQINNIDPESNLPEKPEWEVKSKNYSTEEEAKAALVGSLNIFDIFKGLSYTTAEDSTEYKAIVDLYEFFTYSDGKYTADLYKDGEKNCTVEISFKGGYVLGFSYTLSGEEGISEEYSCKYEESQVYVFKNYGNTTVKAPAGATEAINKAETNN